MARPGSVVLAVVLATPAGAQREAAPAVPTAPPAIVTHDNTRPAGRLENGTLSLELWAGLGRWRAEGEAGRAREVAAFGEERGPLLIPSPLVRVPAGTRVRATIRNTLDSPLHVRGLCERPVGGRCDPLVITPGATREIAFRLAAPGTFTYWADVAGATLADRYGIDSQLGGAIVVDSSGEPGGDRVFVLGMLDASPTPSESLLAVINGRSWPHSERLTYRAGEPVHWRLVNLSLVAHPMHLHGFYFDVVRSGDGMRDEAHPARAVVTERVPPGGTRSIRWIPERAGNWLFHCHMVHHHIVSSIHGASGEHAADSAAHGMQGLVVGISVTGRGSAPPPARPARRLELIVSSDTRHGALPAYRVDLVTGGAPAPRVSDRPVPGPAMVLTRGESVAVDVVNRLAEPTAIHWHGIELESRFDGVPDLSGAGASVTPAVPPGGRFTAHFTPPRAGTFMYHTHWHNRNQLSAGVYGPLVVLEPGERYDPVRDHVIVIGLDGPYRGIPDEPFVVNGENPPSPLVLRAGTIHRLRFIGIAADNPNLIVQLLSRLDPAEWTVVAKDGADIPTAQRRRQPARIGVAVGETWDVELGPMAPGPLWLELRRGDGQLLFQWPVLVR